MQSMKLTLAMDSELSQHQKYSQLRIKRRSNNLAAEEKQVSFILVLQNNKVLQLFSLHVTQL